MMMDRHFNFAGLLLALAAVSCGPQLFTLPVDMRQPSGSGIELGGKSLAVVYADNGFKADSCLAGGIAEGFAQALEEEYFGGEERIDLFQMEKGPHADCSAKDTLVHLIMETERDVVFLLDAPVFKEVNLSAPALSGLAAEDSALTVTAFIQMTQDLYVYDSLDKRDTVLRRRNPASLHRKIYLPRGYTDAEAMQQVALSLRPEGLRAGARLAGPFKPVWHTEEYGVIYYDGDQWTEAAALACDLRWREAMTRWLDLARTKNLEKRSCAEYNLALACYMLGDYPLALEWLDRSDRDCVLQPSARLRSKIKSRLPARTP